MNESRIIGRGRQYGSVEDLMKSDRVGEIEVPAYTKRKDIYDYITVFTIKNPNDSISLLTRKGDSFISFITKE